MLKLLVVAVVAVAGLVVLARVIEARLAFFPAAGEPLTPASAGLAFEAAMLRTSDNEQIRAWLLPAPDARGVIAYFHGNGGNLSIWLPVLAGIRRQGFTVAAIDYRGYGVSSGRPSERGLYRDVDAMVEWVARLERAGVPLVYWGRSLGTTMAAYASTRQRPDRLILEAGFASARSLLRASPPLAFLSLFSSYRFPTGEFARRAVCPALVLHGDRDSVVPFANGRELFEALPDPKQFVTIHGGDHNDAEPPDPDAYWSTIRTFIADGAARSN